MGPGRALTGARVRGPALAAVSGVLAALASPGFGLGPLAAVCLVPLLVATWRARPAQALLRGWLAGTICFGIGMAWVADTTHTYGALPYALTYPVALLLAGYLGLYTGLFALGARLLAGSRVPRVVSLPLLWVALEYARAHLLTGLPWNLLGHAAYRWVRFVQIADLGGIYAVSWFLATLNVCLFALLLPWLDRSRPYRQGHLLNHGLLLFLVPISVAAYGQVRIASLSLASQEHPDPAGPIRVALVQPNIPEDVKWDPGNRQRTLERLERLTREAGALHPDVIVWPEASAPLVLERSPGFLGRVQALAREVDTWLMVGSLAPVPGRPGAVRNALYLMDPAGRIVGQAAKAHLVPFGEYVPLERVLFFVRSLTEGIGDVAPGVGPFLLPHPRGEAAVAVCYELIFPDLVRRRMESGAAYLVTVTNDAWFGRSAAPEQHFANAVFRAVENRTYVVRAANTGISGMVDPYGIVHARTGLDTEAVLQTRIEARRGAPFYGRRGDVAAWGSVIITVVLLGAAVLKRSRNPDT
jgi:apolipoprotein N-acyltransferase